MPISNRCVEPVCVSQVKVPDTVENEFEYIVNATLSNFIKQIACLTIKAKDIFDELTVSLTNIVDRCTNLEIKIDETTFQIKSNTSLVIEPLVGQKIDVYKVFINRDDELLVHTQMPDCIREMFDKAYPPPELHKFDEFRKDNSESLKFYTDPEFFLREWLKNVRVEKKKKKEKKRRRSAAPRKEVLPQFPPPLIINNVVQVEPDIEDCPVKYNFEDVSIYEAPMRYNQYNEGNNNVQELSNTSGAIEYSDLPPPPPPPPLPPPPPAQATIFTAPHTNIPPPAPVENQIQSLLRDIQKGASLKPVTVEVHDKRKTKDFRAMIAELRPAWDNNSESEESEED